MTTTVNYQELGRQAFHNGEPCAPTRNATVREAIADLPVGAGAAEIMRAFTQGWTAANLAAPVPCHPCLMP